MKKLTTILLIILLGATGVHAQTGHGTLKVPLEKMNAKRLPDLNIPRCGHALLYLNGELTVFGGHTTGFIPTPTAEYFKDGTWKALPSIYTHDDGFCLLQKDGAVLLGGGLPEPFGVGQSFSVERYRPDSHSFEPLPILDRKRAASRAVELENGAILVAGNWYADDALEVFSADKGFVPAKELAENRSYPWILPTAPDNALIFSTIDSRGSRGKGWVDRYQGDPFQEPLLTQYYVLNSDGDMVQHICEIGQPRQGDYDYLLLAVNDSLEAEGVLRVHGDTFSLLELETDIPIDGLGGRIFYSTLMEYGGYAWSLGTDASKRAYLLQIGYKPALEGGKATLKLYYTDPLEGLPRYGACTMLPDGQIALAGGIDRSNYTPYATVYLFDPIGISTGSAPTRTAGLITGILTASVLIALGWWIVRRRKIEAPDHSEPDQQGTKNQRDQELFQKVSALMEEGLYKKKGLSIADLATTLGSNTKYISSCINADAGCSFYDYVNGYRIRFAQQLMREDSRQKLSDIADAAGFASESAFYRNFKLVTGETPAEWMARISE